MRRSRTLVFAVGAALIAVGALWTIGPVARDASAAMSPQASRPAAQPPVAGVPEATGDSAVAARAFNEEAFIRDLRAKFGPHLHVKHAQIRSLEQLLSYLRAQYPDDWEARIHDFLVRLFPEQADELYARYQSLAQYTQWLERNRDQLRRLPAADRRQALWEARHAAFGPAADEIWAAELRNQRLSDALQALPADVPVAQRASEFVRAIHEVYGDHADDFLRTRQTELVNRFVATEAVQQELADLEPEARRESLRTLRATLGMEPEALERWDRLDQLRDAQWAAGQRYMAEREQIIANHDEQDAAWRLDELRRTHFGEAADQIAAEEQGGFYRYGGERRYGRE